MFELIIGVIGFWLGVGSLFVVNNQFAVKPVPVPRTLRTERHRTLRRLGSQ